MNKNNSVKYHHGSLPTVLMKQARIMVETDGIESLSLRKIARKIKVSEAAPYHHFPNKMSLLLALAEDGTRDLTNYLKTALQNKEAEQNELNQIGIAYVKFALLHPNLFRFMQGATLTGPAENTALATARKENFGVIYAVVQNMLDGASESQLRRACAAAWSLVHGMATLAMDGRLQTVAGDVNITDLTKDIVQQLNLKVTKETSK